VNSRNTIQGSGEWLQARVGCVTASRVRDVTAQTKSGTWTAGRKNYLGELVCERLTGKPYPQYVSAAMNHGSEMEPQARFRYALASGSEITEVGFVPHPNIPDAGASPDGLVAPDGLVEIKCPHSPGVHIERLLATERNGWGIEPGTYDQMQWQLACMPDRQWVDFVSFDEGLPEKMQLIIRRVPRDSKHIAKMETLVIQFLIDVNAAVDTLRKRYLA
jgi:YqaJ-like viral recombinase domain